ncbi:MAG: hypothetical protein QW584_03845 [Thermofilaceae archaeon]
MPARVELVARVGGSGEAVALLSSYEAPTPQLMIPASTARKPSIQPPTADTREANADTARSSLRV